MMPIGLTEAQFKDPAQNPYHLENHKEHRVTLDYWFMDFGGRYLPGNAWCQDCKMAVAATLEVVEGEVGDAAR